MKNKEIEKEYQLYEDYFSPTSQDNTKPKYSSGNSSHTLKKPHHIQTLT